MTDPQERATVDPRATRGWALLRIGLGTAQVFGAVFAATLLVQGGVTDVALLAVVATGLCTTLSVLLFGSRSPRRKK